MEQTICVAADDHSPKLAEIYISALLVDQDLADAVWEAWDKGEIDDQVACIAWMMIAGRIGES